MDLLAVVDHLIQLLQDIYFQYSLPRNHRLPLHSHFPLQYSLPRLPRLNRLPLHYSLPRLHNLHLVQTDHYPDILHLFGLQNISSGHPLALY